MEVNMEQFEAQDGSVIVRIRLPADYREFALRSLAAAGHEPCDEMIEVIFQGVIDEMLAHERAAGAMMPPFAGPGGRDGRH
jgi:hypothetical protein